MDQHNHTTFAQLAERRREMAALVASGSTLKQAAVAFGVSTRTVSRACKEHGVTQPRPAPGPRRNRILRALIAGVSAADIAEREGVSRQRVYQIAKEARVEQGGGE